MNLRPLLLEAQALIKVPAKYEDHAKDFARLVEILREICDSDEVDDAVAMDWDTQASEIASKLDTLSDQAWGQRDHFRNFAANALSFLAELNWRSVLMALRTVVTKYPNEQSAPQFRKALKLAQKLSASTV